MSIENGKSDTKGLVTAHYDDDGDQYVNIIDKDGDKLEIVNGAVKVNPEPLSKDIDSIDVAKMTKGAYSQVHTAITATATSTEIDCRGFNSILVGIELGDQSTHNWTISIQGSGLSGGVFKDIYEQANTGSFLKMSHQTNINKMILFKGIPDYIKIVATEDQDGTTCTVNVQPLNM